MLEYNFWALDAQKLEKYDLGKHDGNEANTIALPRSEDCGDGCLPRNMVLNVSEGFGLRQVCLGLNDGEFEILTVFSREWMC